MNIPETVTRWTSRQLSMRPGLYAGRGVTTSDLNSQILESLYAGIRHDLGHEQAGNFVRFVNRLEDLTATAFVIALERFLSGGCTAVSVEQRPSDRNALDPSDAMVAQGFAVVAMALSQGLPTSEDVKSESRQLKRDFIAAHVNEIPEGERKDEPRGRGFWR